MIRRLSNREQRIFILCIFLIVVYIIFNGLFKPMKGRIEMIDNNIVSKEIKLSRDLITIRRSTGISNEYEAYLSKFKQVDTDEQVMSKVIAQIEKAAREMQLRISDLKPKRVRRSDFFNKFSVSLTIDSQFADIIQFLYILQSKPHQFNLEEVRFDKGSKRRSETIKTRLVLSKILISTE